MVVSLGTSGTAFAVAARPARDPHGAAASAAVRSVASGLFGVPVDVPVSGEYVALGAARQAARALSGAATPPQWPIRLDHHAEPADPEVGATVRAAYAEARAATYHTSAS